MLSYLCLVRGPVTPVYCDLFEVSDALIYSPLLYILYTVPAKVPAFIPWVIQPDVHNQAVQALACTIILGFKRGLKLEVLFQASLSLFKATGKACGCAYLAYNFDKTESGLVFTTRRVGR